MNAVRVARIEFGRRLAIAAALLLAGVQVCLAMPAATISGVVRDSQGVVQMGAMVQVLAGPVNVATAFTDLYGRYKIANLVPGRYDVRASAALFVPSSRPNLRLANGTRATVNLTLSMLTDPIAWIPAERRRADEPADDWSWTMRASGNRPVLRMTDGGDVVVVSSSAESRPTAPPMVARGAVTSGDGGFGGGGEHNSFVLDRVLLDGSDMVLRTDLGTARTPYGRGPSVELDAGYQRRTMLGGATRLVTSYGSHPEMMSPGGALGLETVRLASAQQMKFGDLVTVEAGGVVYAVRTTGTAMVSRPFVSVAVHPGDTWTVQYRMATAREMQRYDDLNSLNSTVPVTVAMNGRLRTETGTHQELAVMRTAGRATLRAAVYNDRMTAPVISGTGVMGLADLAGTASTPGAMADTVTDAFVTLGRSYGARGVSLLISEPLTSGLWAAVEFQNGEALTEGDAGPQSLAGELSGMHAVHGDALTGAIKGRILRSGTAMRVSYRWEPARMVTPIAAYEAFSDQPYLSCYIRQTIRLGGLLPPGLEATVDVTNLLAEGYRPFLSADGRVLFLAQAPRAVQGGLSFTF
jgi:hypothetical protein